MTFKCAYSSFPLCIDKLMTGTQLVDGAYKYKPVPIFQVCKVLQYMLVLQRALPYLVLL